MKSILFILPRLLRLAASTAGARGLNISQISRLVLKNFYGDSGAQQLKVL